MVPALLPPLLDAESKAVLPDWKGTFEIKPWLTTNSIGSRTIFWARSASTASSLKISVSDHALGFSEQQFAEKLHAYTLPRAGTVNSRVRDLVDMVLLIQSGTLDAPAVAEALLRTFNRRGTHLVPVTLEMPPPDWDLPFQRLADECQLDRSVSKAFAELSRFYETLALSNS